MLFLRQSTASQEVMIGPFLSDTDGKTAQTALTIANTDIKLFVAGATSEVSKNSGGATHIAAGRYYCVLDATDTATVGSGELNVSVAGALPVRRPFTILTALVYDSLIAGSDKLQIDAVQVGGQTASAAGTVTFPGTIASSTNITAGTITTVTTVTNQLTAAQIATGVWQDATAGDFTTASSIGKSLYTSGVVPGGAGGLFIAGTNAATTITTALTTTFTGNLTGSVGSVTGAVTLASGTHTGAVIPTVTTVTNQLTAAAIATGVWQDATAGDFTTASSIGKSLYTGNVAPGGAGGLFIAGTNAATTISTALTTTFTGNLTGSVGSVSGAVGSVTGAVGSVTGNVGGNVVGSVASVTARVTANTDQLAGQTVTAAAGVTFPTSVASPTNITAGTITTVTTVTNQLTAAAIATGVWQDTTAGDFTVASSIGKSLYTSGAVPGAAGGLFIAGTNAATTITTALTTTFTGNLTGSVGSVSGSVGSVVGAVGSVTAAVTLASGTHTGAVIPTVTTVTNQLTAAQVATGVWQDTTAGDFTTASSIGKSLYTSGVVPGGSGGLFIAGTNAATTVTTSFTTTFTGNLTGSVGSVSGAVGSVAGSVGSVTAAVTLPTIPSDWITAAGIAADAIGSSELAASAANEIADAVLSRNVSNVEGTAGEHTLCTIVLACLEFAVSGSTWTIKRTDGSTTHATKTLTTDGAADPITEIT